MPHAGCKGCETLEQTTYMDREVADVLNARRDNPALRMLNREPERVFSPVLIVCAPDGRELRRTTGHLSPQAMLLELHIALAMAKMDGGRWVEAHRILDEAIGRYSLASARNGLRELVCRRLIV
jgi:hypothetical protein